MTERPSSYQWLQISDLHVFDGTTTRLLLLSYKELAKYVKPDLLFVTGDFRHKRRQESSFDNALEFLNQLVSIFSLKKENVFLIPGNHDAGEYENKRIFVDGIRNAVETQPDYYKQCQGTLMGAFREYGDFVRRFYEGSGVSGSRVEEPAAVQSAVWNDAMNVILLNTALVSDGNNEACEIADVYGLSRLEPRRDLPSVILAHHPIERLAASHQEAIRSLMKEFGVRAYLCGDSHILGEHKLFLPYDGAFVPEFICGKSAVEDGDGYSTVGAIQYEWKRNGSVTVYPYAWQRTSSRARILVESSVYNRGAREKASFAMPFPRDPAPRPAADAVKEGPGTPAPAPGPEESERSGPEEGAESAYFLGSSSNLFEIAGLRVKFIPILCSWNLRENEYTVGDVAIETREAQFQMPVDILDCFARSRWRDNQRITENTFEPKVRIDDYSVIIRGGGAPHTPIFHFSRVYYRDYLIQRYLMNEPLQEGKTLRERYFNYRHSLITEQLSNICGVGIFVITRDNQLLISKASRNVTVNPEKYIYTASGTMDWEGGETNPFSDVVRESREEINYTPSYEHLRLYSLGIDYETGYYQFSFYERSRKTAGEIMRSAMFAKDFRNEIDRLKAIPFRCEAVLDELKKGDWDETAKANLITLAAKFFGRETVEKYLNPQGRRKATQEELQREWDKRAERKGALAVLSSRYPSLQIDAISRSYWNKVVSFIDDPLEDRSVLEVGGGIGLFTKYFAQRGARVTCVDVSEKMIQRSREYLGEELASRVRYVRDFFQNYEPDQVFDLLVCSLVLIHNIDELEEITANMKRCARTIYLFEHVEDGVQGSRYTHPKSEAEYISLFPEYTVEKKDTHLLFTDHIACIKLVRRS